MPAWITHGPQPLPLITRTVTVLLSFCLQRQGNDALKQGLAIRKKFYLRKAVEHYTAGIAVGVSDAALNSVLHANRAQAEIKLGNSRNAMRDALRAVQLDPENMKVGLAAVLAELSPSICMIRVTC